MNKLSRQKIEAKMFRYWSKTKKFAEKMLFPDNIKCIFCGVDIDNFEERPYCDECAKILPFNNGHRCEICDQPILDEANVCDLCQKEKKNFKKAFCPFLYEGSVKNLVLKYKDSNCRYLAQPLANIISKCLEGIKIDIITYIPMTEKKEKKRTFNQSKLLAEEIGKILNCPVLCCFAKIKDKVSQKNLIFKERRQNIIGTFIAKDVNLNRNQNVLIVDDVLTTCSTVSYCAGLIYPKVNNIYVCGIAREYVRPEKTLFKTKTFFHQLNK